MTLASMTRKYEPRKLPDGPRVATTAMKSASVSTMGSQPTVVNPSSCSTSCGATRPPAARLSVRISTMVRTIVSSTINVTPKTFDNSLRND